MKTVTGSASVIVGPGRTGAASRKILGRAPKRKSGLQASQNLHIDSTAASPEWDEIRDGRAQLERAIELDPHNTFFQWAIGLQLIWERRYDEAITQLNKALTLQPDSPDARSFLILALHQKGRLEEELAEMRKRAAPEFRAVLDSGYAQGGYRGARLRAAEFAVRRSERAYVQPTNIATHYALAGEKDLALKWLEKAYEEPSSQMVFLQVHP